MCLGPSLKAPRRSRREGEQNRFVGAFVEPLLLRHERERASPPLRPQDGATDVIRIAERLMSTYAQVLHSRAFCRHDKRVLGKVTWRRDYHSETRLQHLIPMAQTAKCPGNWLSPPTSSHPWGRGIRGLRTVPPTYRAACSRMMNRERVIELYVTIPCEPRRETASLSQHVVATTKSGACTCRSHT